MKKLISVSVVSALIVIILWVLRIFEVTDNALILTLIGAALFLFGSLALKILMPRMRTHRFFSLKSMTFLEWQVVFCLSTLLICGSFLLNYLTGLLYGELSIDAPSAFSDGGYSSVGSAILCVAVVPALFEELFFRGAVLTTLRTAKVKDWLAVLFSALLFMLLHGPSWYFLTDFYAGVLLALLVYLTGSLYAAVAAHFISNFVSYFLALYGGKLVDAGIGNLTIHVVVVCLLGAVCHLLHLLKKLMIKRDEDDRSRVNENSRRWEEKMAKGENSHGKKR